MSNACVAANWWTVAVERNVRLEINDWPLRDKSMSGVALLSSYVFPKYTANDRTGNQARKKGQRALARRAALKKEFYSE